MREELKNNVFDESASHSNIYPNLPLVILNNRERLNGYIILRITLFYQPVFNQDSINFSYVIYQVSGRREKIFTWLTVSYPDSIFRL